MKKIEYFGKWISYGDYLFNLENHHLVNKNGILVDKNYFKTDNFKNLIKSNPHVDCKKSKANQILAIEITEDCNYSCIYCFEENACHVKKDSISYGNACNSINKLPNGSKLRFFGGEPLINFELVKKIVKTYPQHSYSIVTNGSLLNKEISSFLAEYNFSVGLSYDGFGWQKKNRKSLLSDSQRDFERAVQLLSDSKVHTGVSTVITKESIPYLYDIHLEVFDDYPINGWAYLIGYTSDMTLSDLDIFKENVLGIVEDFPAIHLLRINDLRKWSMKITGEWPIDGFCGAGTCYKAITSNGEERFCPFFLRESSCYGPNIGLVEVDCKRCSIWNFCKGGCLALNKFGTGKTNKSHPFSCKKNHIYFEAGLKTRIKVREELEKK